MKVRFATLTAATLFAAALTMAADGSWTRNNNDYEGVGPVYTTAIAVITLSVPAGYLPIFQR